MGSFGWELRGEGGGEGAWRGGRDGQVVWKGRAMWLLGKGG